MIAAVFIQLFFLGVEADQTNDSIVYWHERKLSWNDFKGSVQVDSDHGAITHSSIHAPCKSSGDTLYCNVYAEFNMAKSWVKTDKATNALLNHEQRHFDITEYMARCYRRDMLTHRFISLKTAGNEIKEIMRLNHESLITLEKQYDVETNHSKNKDGQSIWDRKIDSLLVSMSQYSDPAVKVYIGYLRKTK